MAWHIPAVLHKAFWWAVVVFLLEVLRRLAMDMIEQLAVTLIMGVLSKVIKNPKSMGITNETLQHIRDDATQALDMVNPSAPPPPGYVKAS